MDVSCEDLMLLFVLILLPEASQNLKEKVKEGGMVTLLWINK